MTAMAAEKLHGQSGLVTQNSMPSMQPAILAMTSHCIQVYTSMPGLQEAVFSKGQLFHAYAGACR